MVMLWLMYLLLGVETPPPARGQAAPPGLSCVNDFVSQVSCRWAVSGAAPQPACRVVGSRTVVSRLGGQQQEQILNRSCDLKPPGGNLQGCSFVFESPAFTGFSWAEDLPHVQVDCNGSTVERIQAYSLREHIQMNPPGLPNISSSANETRISWPAGRPLSRHLEDFHNDFEVQIKHNDQPWQEARVLSTREQELVFPLLELRAGLYQVRVRVRPPEEDYSSHWSSWGPVAAWEHEPHDHMRAGEAPALSTSAYVKAGLSALALPLLITLLLITYRCKPRLFRSKPVPDPSKYFQGRAGLHGAGLKNWLNPRSAFGPYFIALSSDSISPVAVGAPQPPPSSSSGDSSVTTALLHPLSTGSTSPDPSSFSYVSSVSSAFSSSPSSSACFSNPSYVPPGDPDHGPPATGPSHEPRLRGPLHLRPLHLGPFPPALGAYRPPGPEPHPHHPTEPQSPDSGISVGTKFLAEEGMDKGWEEEEEEEEEEKGFNSLWEHGLRHVFLLASRSSPDAPPSDTPSATNKHLQALTPDPLNEDREDYEDDDDYDAYEEEYDCNLMPVGGAMGRSSSMPVEACSSGYHTLKDLQTTYSSISI